MSWCLGCRGASSESPQTVSRVGVKGFFDWMERVSEFSNCKRSEGQIGECKSRAQEMARLVSKYNKNGRCHWLIKVCWNSRKRLIVSKTHSITATTAKVRANVREEMSTRPIPPLIARVQRLKNAHVCPSRPTPIPSKTLNHRGREQHLVFFPFPSLQRSDN